MSTASPCLMLSWLRAAVLRVESSCFLNLLAQASSCAGG